MIEEKWRSMSEEKRRAASDRSILHTHTPTHTHIYTGYTGSYIEGKRASDRSRANVCMHVHGRPREQQ